MPTTLPASPTGTAPSTADIVRALRPCFSSEEAFVFLFGSRATGTAAPMADWDIGVIAPGPVPGRVMTAARDALDDLPTLHRFDLVDFATVSPSFHDAALADAIPLIGVRP